MQVFLARLEEMRVAGTSQLRRRSMGGDEENETAGVSED